MRRVHSEMAPSFLGITSVGVFLVCLLSAVGVLAQQADVVVRTTAAKYTTFAAPDGGTLGSQGTFGVAINAGGEVAGYYQDSSNTYHGFLRTSTGKITEFDSPDGITNGTFPIGINTTGQIAGYYVDANNIDQGFLRGSDGTITEFNVQGSWTGVGGINDAGQITGYYAVSGIEANQAFVRSSDGTVTTFEQEYVTAPFGINTAGEVGGYYLDSSLIYHGFVRTSNGQITTFNLPGGPGLAHYVGGINTSGQLAGYYFDGNAYHGFLRTNTGKLTYFEAPRAGKGYSQGTVALGINAAGTITGYYVDSNNIVHGFVRSSNGTTTDFDVPGATQTFPSAINKTGQIVGFYLSNSGYRGFVRRP
jgi:hypothetical protein